MDDTSDFDASGATLTTYERYWGDICTYLESHGYVLRPRYRPGWQPSWKLNNTPILRAEDFVGLPLHTTRMIDATRVSDGKLVYLKKVASTSLELDLARYFSTEELRQDPRNHCVPLLDVIPHPDDPTVSFMVMPFLRYVNRPPFETIEDMFECGEQILEGLAFMHQHGVAHRDCAYPNVMMDASALYPQGFHPVYQEFSPNIATYAPVLPRSSVPITYYLVDFGISTRFSVDEPVRLVLGKDGIEDTVPELSDDVPYDPFKTDVYIAGALFREIFLNKFSNVGMIAPLVAWMTAPDPKMRPDISESLHAWRRIRKDTSPLQKSWRVKPRDESLLGGMFRDAVSLINCALGNISATSASR
ncbi:kinase-like domain-containing protein [Trametes maxima]|nr:kinase-like domain-containing protein [Trametes maxima]